MIVGIVSGLVILFDYLQYPHLISKQNALDIAMQQSLCADNSTNLNTGIHLLHVKNDSLFSVNEKTMTDISLATASRFKNPENNQYVWEITWECYFSISKERGTQVIFVDAVTGKLLE